MFRKKCPATIKLSDGTDFNCRLHRISPYLGKTPIESILDDNGEKIPCDFIRPVLCHLLNPPKTVLFSTGVTKSCDEAKNYLDADEIKLFL